MPGGVAEVDIYLAALPPAPQAALRSLRATLARFLPDHVETISYAMPGFRQPGPKGKMVAGYAAFARHLGLYPHSGSILPQLVKETTGFKTSQSGILFTPDRPLPADLVQRIVALRQAELAR